MTDLQQLARECGAAHMLRGTAGAFGGKVVETFDFAPAALVAFRAAILEEAAKVAESAASCPCNGSHGYCTTNGPALAIAADIRGMKS